jgi:hypothetical protein
MPTRRKTAPDEIVLAVGEVTSVDLSVSFVRGHHDRFGVTTWSEVITMEVICRLTDWTFKGIDILKLSMTHDRRVEGPDRIRALARTIHRPFRGSASEARRLAHRMCGGVAPGARCSGVC